MMEVIGVGCLNMKARSIYNFLAEMICCAKKSDPESYTIYANREARRYPEAEEIWVRNYIGELTQHISDEKLVMDGIPDEFVEKWRTHLAESEDPYACCVLTLGSLTQHMSWRRIIESGYVHALGKGFEALNDNGDDTGVYILPFVSSITIPQDPNESKNKKPNRWGDRFNTGINSLLASGSVYYIDREDLPEGYRLSNTIINNYHHWSKNKKDGEKIKGIRIAFAPVTVKNHLRVIKLNNGRYGCFDVKICEQNELDEAIDAAYVSAVLHEADIVVFPEMLGTDRFRIGDEDRQRRNPFSDKVRELEELGYQMQPWMVLSPTRSEDGRNIIGVRDEGGGLLAVVDKQHSFVYSEDQDQGMEEKWREILDNKQKILHIIHVPEVGRITFAVCVDLLHEDYTSMLAGVLKSTLILCPSYTPGRTLFRMKQASEWEYGCALLWGNTCSALDVQQDNMPFQQLLGMVSVPYYQPVTKELVCNCEKECQHDPAGCLFLVDIGLTEAYLDVSFVCPHKGRQ